MITLYWGSRTGSVRQALEAIRGLVPTDSGAIIRQLDSISDPQVIEKVLRDAGLVSLDTPGGVWIDYSRLSMLMASHHVFSHFDEVWILEKPSSQPLEVAGLLTSPITDLTGNTLTPSLVDAVERHRAVVALGDGLGLNYVTSRREIHDTLVRVLSP